MRRKDRERMLFSVKAPKFGFCPGDYRKVVKKGKKLFYFVGIDERAAKNVCVLREISSGDEYLGSPELLLKAR